MRYCTYFEGTKFAELYASSTHAYRIATFQVLNNIRAQW